MSLFKTNTQPDSIHGILEGMVAKAGTRPAVRG